MTKTSYILGGIALAATIAATIAVSQGVTSSSEELDFPSGPFGEFRWQDQDNGIQIAKGFDGTRTPILRKVDLSDSSAVYVWIRDDGDMETTVMFQEDCKKDDLIPIGLSKGVVTSRHLRCYPGEQETFLWTNYIKQGEKFDWVWSEELNNWKVHADFRQWPLQEVFNEVESG